MYLFSNVLGVFVFDEKFKVEDEILFKDLEEYNNKEKFIDKLLNKHKNLKEPDETAIKNILNYFKNKEFLGNFYDKNLQLAKLNVKNSVNNDNFIAQSVNFIGDIDKSINILVKRLREWYDLYNPEYSRSIQSHELFVQEILANEKHELLKKLGIDENGSIGANLSEKDLQPIKNIAHQIQDLYNLRKSQLDYISSLMDKSCPNIKAVCDVMIGSKLIEHAGSLKRLSEMPSSTIQILGAEKALFRHMKTGAKPPRHGIIVGHPLIAQSAEMMHGKIARALADKISIAAKVDFFHGQFIGDKLRKALEEKFINKN